MSASTSSNDSRLIFIDLAVEGARRSLRALVDSGASNNFIGSGILGSLPPGTVVRELPGNITVRMADGKPRSMPKRIVSLGYKFDGFQSIDEFLVIDLNQSFDCIFGMPWLRRHQPEIDWIGCSVKAKRPLDVSEVCANLARAKDSWFAVTVVDRSKSTYTDLVCDGPLCVACGQIVKVAASSESKPGSGPSVLTMERAPIVCAPSRVKDDESAAGSGPNMLTMERDPIVCVPSSVKEDSDSGPTLCNSSPQMEEVERYECDSQSTGTSPATAARINRSRSGPIEGVTSEVLTTPINQSAESKAAIDESELPVARNTPANKLSQSADGQTVSGERERPAEIEPVVEDYEELPVYTVTTDGDAQVQCARVKKPPDTMEELLSLPVLSWQTFLKGVKKGEYEQVCVISAIEETEQLSAREQRFADQSWESLRREKNPAYDLICKYADIFPEKIPAELPQDRGVRHEIDLVPGTKYCVTRQWPLPREQVEAIDEFFAKRYAAGHVRESKSPHSSPTFCVKKATGGWRIVHAYNKLNDATIPAQTPIPRKDMVLDSMSGSTKFSAIDLTDGFYQILMREKDIPLTAVSTPSGMLWEWLVMPQGMKNAPATFNRMVSHVLRPYRHFAPSYFDDIFVHSAASEGRTDIEVHLEHLRQVFDVMRKNKLYANLKKCIFCASEIPVLGCFVGKDGVRPDPEKVASIRDWPSPTSQKQLRQWLGLANYLHKYTKDYARLIHPLSQLLRKDIEWEWLPEHQSAFDAVKKSLSEAPVLMLPDYSKPFHVVCDASQFAIGCALMQFDGDNRERVISYQSRQLRPAEKNYPVHDKELLAMRYALVKFRVYLLGESKFIVYTDHASLRTAIHSPHLSQRMARWLSFFAEYNFVVHYKPGKLNILADALSRRPDYDSKSPPDEIDGSPCPACDENECNLVASTATNNILDRIREAYHTDLQCSAIIKHLSDTKPKPLSARLNARIHRYDVIDGLLVYRVDKDDEPRVVVPCDDDLRATLIHEYHDSPSAGHLGREKTYALLSRAYYWNRMYSWVRKWIRTCEVCQRVKPLGSAKAPLQSLPIPSDNWQSVSMDFVFGLPPDRQQNTGILVFVDRLSKMVHLSAVRAAITAEESADIFLNTVFRLHGLPKTIVSDRDPRFTSAFWTQLFSSLGTRLNMSTTSHPETDGQTERVNRVMEDILRSYATSYDQWSDALPLVEFAINNSTHSSTGVTPFYANYARHPRVAASLLGPAGESPLGGGEDVTHLCDVPNVRDDEPDVTNLGDDEPAYDAPDVIRPLAQAEQSDTASEVVANPFLLKRQGILQFVRDNIAEAVDRQKQNADRVGRKHTESFTIGDRVLLSTANLPLRNVSNTGTNKLIPRFIGPFKVIARKGIAYTLDIPSYLRLHPTFYVGRLKRYHPAQDGLSNDVTSDASAEVPTPAHAAPEAGETSQPRHPATVAARAPPHAECEPGSKPAPTVPRRLTARLGQRLLRLLRFGAYPSRHAAAEPALDQEKASYSETALAEPPEPPEHEAECETTHQRRSRFERTKPPPLIDSEGQRRWIVDRIVAHRDVVAKNRGRKSATQRQYRVRWLGYSHDADTWEPKASLAVDVPDVVREYESGLTTNQRA